MDFPQIVVLTGCDGESVRASRGDGRIVVRTALTAGDDDRRGEEEEELLLRRLEGEIAREVSAIIAPPLLPSGGAKIGSVSIELIDEDPSSHSVDGGGDSSSKARLDDLGVALSSSARAALSPLLDDLSFVHGGRDVEVVAAVASGAEGGGATVPRGSEILFGSAIDLVARSSAHLPPPDGIVVVGAGRPEGGGEEGVAYKLVSSDGVGDWVSRAAARPSRRGGRGGGASRDRPRDVEWTLLVPSMDKSPLLARDDASGEVGRSVVLSPPGAASDERRPNGASIVNAGRPSEAARSGPADPYREGILSSLSRDVVGYLRSVHGLPAAVAEGGGDGGGGAAPRAISFWELESIAREGYPSSLDRALREADALMALLRVHGGSLALPEDVAREASDAARLLRQSVDLVERGYPVVYASSLLHGSLRRLGSVRGDHRLHELPYFAPDHYLAVFSPLVLPLLLPMIAGLVREVKRYRELTKKSRIVH